MDVGHNCKLPKDEKNTINIQIKATNHFKKIKLTSALPPGRFRTFSLCVG